MLERLLCCTHKNNCRKRFSSFSYGAILH